MGAGKTIWKWTKKVGKFAWKHQDEIEKTVKVVAKVVDTVADGPDTYEVPEYMAEDVQSVAELKNFCENKFRKLDANVQDMNGELDTVKKAFAQQLQSLENRLEQLAEMQIYYQRRQTVGFWLVGVLGGVGIVTAVVLAVIL